MPLDRRTPMPPALGSYSARPAIPPMTRPGAIRLAPRTHRPSSTLHHPSPATAAREHRPTPTTATPRGPLMPPVHLTPTPAPRGTRASRPIRLRIASPPTPGARRACIARGRPSPDTVAGEHRPTPTTTTTSRRATLTLPDRRSPMPPTPGTRAATPPRLRIAKPPTLGARGHHSPTIAAPRRPDHAA